MDKDMFTKDELQKILKRDQPQLYAGFGKKVFEKLQNRARKILKSKNIPEDIKNMINNLIDKAKMKSESQSPKKGQKSQLIQQRPEQSVSSLGLSFDQFLKPFTIDDVRQSKEDNYKKFGERIFKKLHYLEEIIKNSDEKKILRNIQKYFQKFFQEEKDKNKESEKKQPEKKEKSQDIQKKTIEEKTQGTQKSNIKKKREEQQPPQPKKEKRSWSNKKQISIPAQTIGIGIGPQKKLKIEQKQSFGKAIVQYTLKMKSVEKIAKMIRSLDEIMQFLKKPNFSNLFCDFYYEQGEGDQEGNITIKVMQQNRFEPDNKQENFDEISFIKELSKGYLQLIKSQFIKEIGMPWKLFTPNSITLGKSLKVNLVQGLIETFTSEGKKNHGEHLSFILTNILKNWEKNHIITLDKAKQKSRIHFLKVLEKIEVVQNPEGEAGVLQTILSDHPLFLSDREKRVLIHDVSDYWEYIKSEPFLKHYPKVKETVRERVLRTLNDWINYHAYIQNVDSEQIFEESYNWISTKLKNVVDRFNDFNRNSNKSTTIYQYRNFNDHLRFIRNILFHASTYKKDLTPSYQTADELLHILDGLFPNLITFVYEVNHIIRKLFKQLIHQCNRQNQQNQILLTLEKFTIPDIQDISKATNSKINMILKTFFNFFGANDIQKKLKEAMLRVQSKLNYYQIHFASQVQAIRQITIEQNILHNHTTVISNLKKDTPDLNPIENHLKIFELLVNKISINLIKEREKANFKCLQTDILWSLYAALNQSQDLLCPDFHGGFGAYCNNRKQCPYYHPNQSCPAVIKGKQCQDPKCSLYHPKLCQLSVKKCHKKDCKMHLPICYDYYYNKCDVWQCKSRSYHPPMGICVDDKYDECQMPNCAFYHPQDDEIPSPRSLPKRISFENDWPKK